MKTQNAQPHPQVIRFSEFGVRPKLCISNKFLGDADAAFPRLH